MMRPPLTVRVLLTATILAVAGTVRAGDAHGGSPGLSAPFHTPDHAHSIARGGAGGIVTREMELGAVGPVPSILYRPRVEWVWGPNGWVPYAPPLVVVGPGGGFPITPLPPPVPPVLPDPGLGAMAPAPPPILPPTPAARPRVIPTRRRRVDPERVQTWMTYGDRDFRAGDMPHAEERYEQVVAADPDAAAPRATGPGGDRAGELPGSREPAPRSAHRRSRLARHGGQPSGPVSRAS